MDLNCGRGNVAQPSAFGLSKSGDNFMAVKTTHPRRGKDQAANPAPADNGQSISTGGPQFGESTPTPDPTKFTVKHGSDNNAYSILDHEKGKLKPLPFKIAEDVEPVLQLADALGHTGANIVAQIQRAGQ